MPNDLADTERYILLPYQANMKDHIQLFCTLQFHLLKSHQLPFHFHQTLPAILQHQCYVLDTAKGKYWIDSHHVSVNNIMFRHTALFCSITRSRLSIYEFIDDKAAFHLTPTTGQNVPCTLAWRACMCHHKQHLALRMPANFIALIVRRTKQDIQRKIISMVEYIPGVALLDHIMGLFEKRRARKFFLYVQDFEENDSKTHEGMDLTKVTAKELIS